LEGKYTMIRYAFSAVAAAAITFGTVSALNAETPKVTIDQKNGDYCLTDPAMTGSHIPHTECHSVGEWSKMGVSFARVAK
jgi:hypothetical protein